MSTTCDGCVFAEWKRTIKGALHPSKRGRCKRLEQYPLDLRLPAAFSWHGNNPSPYGGYIQRGEVHRDKCVF